MVAAPVGFHCATCVSEAAGRVRQIQRIGTGAPLITYTLIAVNVAVALASLASSPDWMQGEGGEVAVRGGLLGGGLTLQDGSPELIGVDRGEWYRIFTGAFIHGGLIHLFFNMLILWQAGSRARWVGCGSAHYSSCRCSAALSEPSSLAPMP
jgi:membrane associated rhomboid family serine protease